MQSFRSNQGYFMTKSFNFSVLLVRLDFKYPHEKSKGVRTGYLADHSIVQAVHSYNIFLNTVPYYLGL